MARTSELTNFDAVVAEYWPRIYRFALVSLREKGAAESLAQDCFLRAWKYRDQFRGDAAVSTWPMQIAVNLIRDRRMPQQVCRDASGRCFFCASWKIWICW